ncbi:ATP-binding cassette domain-containing protein [Aeromicrobium fastidiosum]|uniref:Sugar ABC transporter ATP-binding protein n=1 Tax=Aeromicrobium fastidiosum TaxID=52699 RepID=A0A641AIS5_9ACTN|nr:ATP-binding cassette domain-containing protein [Aeromicrobium fastidiosum]KAA1374799.1 sugar ABC transporter ATP-binding protein [Aeromicrobium fastidiosum]MBP2390650.1 simple sugar transport system ATP-binding protein [Aeromicrobium fastidiosum]
MTTMLSAENITVTFSGNYAVHDVSLHVDPGSVLCLLGDNGAGKSTLIKVLSGVYQPSSGNLRLDGDVVTFPSPRAAREAGISTVHQYGGTAPLMSVDRNFFIGSELTRRVGPIRFLHRSRMRSEALQAISELGLTRVTNARQLVGTMSGGERQALAIARAVYFGARVLILDEPTSALGVKEAALVLRLIDQVRASGVAVIFITHNAQHAMAIGDRFQVLIGGRTAADFARGEKTRNEVLDLMAGGEEFAALAGDLGGSFGGDA